MDFEIISAETQVEDRSRFAVGKHTGSLYFVPNILDIEHMRSDANIRAVPIIGKGTVRVGHPMFVSAAELLPPGTTIKITT